MKIRFLLLGTSLSLIPSLTSAQCVATQDCATLGYTETSCSGGNGVKCPFGNKWACFKSESEFCNEYGFTQTCTGTNQTGGASKACNGKYTECTCATGYEWKDGNCQQQILNGAQGDLYYCNGTVVGVKASGMNFYVAMKDLGALAWDKAMSKCQSYAFCGDVTGTLPTRSQLKSIYNNKSQVNSLLLTNGGTQLRTSHHWSSDFYIDNEHYPYAYFMDMSNGWVDDDIYFGAGYVIYARPILTSW